MCLLRANNKSDDSDTRSMASQVVFAGRFVAFVVRTGDKYRDLPASVTIRSLSTGKVRASGTPNLGNYVRGLLLTAAGAAEGIADDQEGRANEFTLGNSYTDRLRSLIAPAARTSTRSRSRTTNSCCQRPAPAREKPAMTILAAIATGRAIRSLFLARARTSGK